MHRIFLGAACNNACITCPIGAADREPPRRFEGVEELIVKATDDEAIAFTGGEPTLAPELPKWIALARERGAPRIIVQTNARRLAYRAYLEELLAAGAGRLAIEATLFGSNAAMHDYHTAVEGSFKQTCTGIANAARARVQVGVQVVATRSNYRHLVEIARVVKALGATAARIVIASAEGRAAAPSVQPNPEMVEPHRALARRELASLESARFPFVGWQP
ncbi:MAG: radical SAM protein [Polyangiaceae bacterium]